MCELEFAWLRERVTRGECHETSDLCDLFCSDCLDVRMRNKAASCALFSPGSKCWRGSESQAFARKPTTTVRRRRRRRHTTRDLKREPSTSSSNCYTRRSSSNARCSVNSRVLNPSVNQPREAEREARGRHPVCTDRGSMHKAHDPKESAIPHVTYRAIATPPVFQSTPPTRDRTVRQCLLPQYPFRCPSQFLRGARQQ